MMFILSLNIRIWKICQNIKFTMEEESNEKLVFLDHHNSFQVVRVKNITSEWFDGEIAEKICTQDKLYKKCKLTRLHVDKEIYKEMCDIVQNLICKEKLTWRKKSR